MLKGDRMGRAEYKVEGGKLVKAQVIIDGNIIRKVKITGDFFLHPEELIEELEEALVGSLLDESNLAKLIRGVIEKKNAILLGASPEDFAKCIVMAGKMDG
jgi:lipoate-protein ligase A